MMGGFDWMPNEEESVTVSKISLSLVLALLMVCIPSSAQEVFRDCPMEGDAKLPHVAALNRLKNRFTAPPVINPAITLQAILAPGDDRTRWKVRDGAEVVGYVSDVKVGGVETCNCHARRPDDRDTHIELVQDPMDGSAPRLIVEVTPRWRAIMAARGIDWRTDAIRRAFLGRWVRVTGWMLLDTEHLAQAENTAPGQPGNWRGSCWEIHPVCGIEVVSRVTQ